MTHKLEDKNRRDLDFTQSRVRELLPEYYQVENPTLITFLEKYYDYLDSDNFETDIHQLKAIRDVNQADEKFLDLLIEEIGNGLKLSSFFDEPRLMSKLLADFYRVKGSRSSIEGFFRAFFGTEIEVEYTKKDIFFVNESKIGYDDQKFLTDNKLYQTFAILIKCGISVSDYRNLYKQFVHPAGFFFAGQTVLETEFDFELDDLEVQAIDSAGSLFKGPVLQGLGLLEAQTDFTQLTGKYDSSGQCIRIDLDKPISLFADYNSVRLDSYYSGFTDVLNVNSKTLDDSDKFRMSLTFETMDKDWFTQMYSDSCI